MKRFASAIKCSTKESNWLAALFLALAIPDICGALENPPTGKKGEVAERYQNWFDKYLRMKYAPRNLYELVISRNPESAARMRQEEIESLKLMPPNENCLFTAGDCYRFRCKCLHEGLIEKMDGETFVFITPPKNGNVVHGNNIEGKYQLQVDIFCDDTCIAIDEWLKDIEGSMEVQLRIDNLIQIYQIADL